jgi:SAM-dependent methyltransferase
MARPPLELVRRVSNVSRDNPYHAELAEKLDWVDLDDVVGTNEEIGRRCRDTVLDLLPGEWEFAGRNVLEFGCGIGRVMRHFRAEAEEAAEFHGCDIDEPSVEWLREHCSPPFVVTVNGDEPPLPYPDEHFDLVYVISVFTHLTDSWARWLLELRRVLKPDGLLIATFAGEGNLVAIQGPPWNEVWDEDRIGMNLLLPHASWAHGGPAVFHSEWWIREHWGRAFEILELRRDGLAAMPGRGQGQVLMRRRAGEVTAADLERPADDPRELEAMRHNREQLAREIRALAEQIDSLRDHAEALGEERDRAIEWAHDATRRFEDAQAAYQALDAARQRADRHR